MPNCYQLTRKGEYHPSSRIEIDEELCQFFDAPCHPTEWFHGWADIIGLPIALGKPLGSPELRASLEQYASTEVLDILNYLETHFTSDAWATIGHSPSLQGDSHASH